MFPALLFAISVAFGPRIIDLSLQFDDNARQSLQRAPNHDVPATLTLHHAPGEETFAVTVHVKGQTGSARPIDDKPAFKIKLTNGKRLLGLEHLTLNNMVQDPTMLHEAIGYQVYADAGVAAPSTGYVRLTVDGREQGLYLNVETIDRQFLERVFHDGSGILYEANYGVDLRDGDEGKFELDEGSDPNHAQLRALIAAVHTGGDGVFYGSGAQVDTAGFLSMMAAGALLADWDNYYAANNYRIYWNPATHRWHFIPTGIDQTFNPDTTSVFGAIGVLFQKCLASDRCTNDYAKAVGDVSVRFERLGLATRIDALLSVIEEPSRADSKRPYDDAAMRSAREAMRLFVDAQPGRVRDQVSCLRHNASVAACAGHVIVSGAGDGCLEVASGHSGRHGAAARVGRCLGGPRQRWHLVATGDAFALKSPGSGECLELAGTDDEGDTHVNHAACNGSATQLFALRPGAGATHLVAKGSGKCLAAAPGDEQTQVIVERRCAPETAQDWRVQRSIFR
jgi:hypothetical protein